MKRKLTKAAQIRAYIEKYPRAEARDIAEACNCQISRVYNVQYSLRNKKRREISGTDTISNDTEDIFDSEHVGIADILEISTMCNKIGVAKVCKIIEAIKPVHTN